METKGCFNKKIGLCRLISGLCLSPVIRALPLPGVEKGIPSPREIYVLILGRRGEGRGLCASAESHLSSAKNNPWAKLTHFRVAYPDHLQW